MKNSNKFFVLLIGIIILSFVYASLDSESHEEKINLKKLPLFDLEIPPQGPQKNNFRVSSSNYPEEEVNIIVSLKDPKRIWGFVDGMSQIDNSNLEKILRLHLIREFNLSSRNLFLLFNGFSTRVNQEKYNQLLVHPLVNSIEFDNPVSVFLENSTSIVQSDLTNNLILNEINLSGEGQTVCIIDTGIDYTHPDLGNCERIYTNQSQVNEISITSPNYPDNYSNNFGPSLIGTANIPGADSIQVYFDFFELEDLYSYEGQDYLTDYVVLYDEDDNLIWIYYGSLEPFWSVSIPGDTVKIVFSSDESINYSGFNISQAKGYFHNSECDKILAGHNFYDGNIDPLDDHGHGTHVAGIVAANGNLKGVSPETKLVAVKALDGSGRGITSDILAGIEYCINNAEEYNISVISMSLGGGNYSSFCNSDFLSSSINLATSKNISVVVATGNEGLESRVASPACVENAIRVGSSTKSDNAVFSFSNRWALGMLLAPGTNINSTMPSYEACLTNSSCTAPPYNNHYDQMSGTSMATPHVSGAIAIINQYLVLTNRTMTPKQIESILNSTGKIILDSGTGNNYSRIDIYSAILSLDNTAPEVYLQNNGEINSTTNQTFYCNATDWQLSNMTFYLWNSTGNLINNETKQITGASNESYFNFGILGFGTYNYSCNVTDSKGNVGYSGIKTTTIANYLTLDAPSNNTHTNQNQTNFTCSAFSQENYDLTNITFYLWNSTGNISENQTRQISGTSNTTTFEYNFTEEGAYSWNCHAFNNNSDSSFAEQNLTITYDITKPTFNPLPSTTTTSSATISFNTNESTNATIFYNSINQTNSNYSNNHTFTLSGLSSSTKYYYNITSCDRAGNCANYSSEFTTQTPVTTSGGSGPSSSSSPSAPSAPAPSTKDIEITKEELKSGSTIKISKDEKITFQINSTNHTITLFEIKNDSVKLEIRSDPINITLEIGQEEKINLTSKEYYDLYLKLNSIEDKNANITLQSIYEKIISPEEPPMISEDENLSQQNDSKKPLKKIIPISLITIALIILITWIIINKTKIKKTIKYYQLYGEDKKTESKTKRKR